MKPYLYILSDDPYYKNKIYKLKRDKYWNWYLDENNENIGIIITPDRLPCENYMFFDSREEVIAYIANQKN